LELRNKDEKLQKNHIFSVKGNNLRLLGTVVKIIAQNLNGKEQGGAISELADNKHNLNRRMSKHTDQK